MTPELYVLAFALSRLIEVMSRRRACESELGGTARRRPHVTARIFVLRASAKKKRRDDDAARHSPGKPILFRACYARTPVPSRFNAFDWCGADFTRMERSRGMNFFCRAARSIKSSAHARPKNERRCVARPYTAHILQDASNVYAALIAVEGSGMNVATRRLP